MKLRKYDPIYYRNKLMKLLNQAIEENVEIKCDVLNNGIKIYFKSGIDIASVDLTE